ncbi:MAG: xanthine dehydrogenase [Verrucomicrobia bacterium]|nr:xanthine dehydrogenase [Verrucomicrobiota bacterium]
MTDTTTTPVAGSFEFTLNGEAVRVRDVAATTTLLNWLRSTGRTGSKCGCDEGDCGACTVAIVDRDASGAAAYRALNSCIALLPMLAGREIVTVEGLARDGELHPVQASMVENYGSQCGYCTPGFVVSLFEAYHRKDCDSPAKINDQLCGNLCRCTGYRPIRDAALSALASRGADPATDDRFAARLRAPVPVPGSFDYASGAGTFHRPDSLAALLGLLAAHPEARLVAGATEIGVDLNKKQQSFPVLVSTDGVPELRRLDRGPDGWTIGAAVPLTLIEERIAPEHSALAKMLRVFASRQIRNRATLGGNLGTASPIGDSAPLLMMLDARLVLVSAGGERTVELADFFTGYRQTALRRGEIIREVFVPHSVPTAGLTRRGDFIKVSRRSELDISIVAAAFSVDLDGDDVVRRARLAYGGVADRTRRALKAEAALVGRKLGDAGIAEILAGEFAPIDDVRASAAYRRGLVVSLWERFVSGDTSIAHEENPPYRPGAVWTVSDVTRRSRHESAVGHVTGRALYVDDTAQQRPMLDVWPVMAAHAHARITRRDAAAARRAPGIRAVLLAEDIPGVNNVGVSRHDEPLLARDEVLYHSQMIAVVVGDSRAACRAAAALVEVDYEPLDPILGIGAAIARGSYHTDPHTLSRGDCVTALAASALRFDGEIEFGGQEHFYLETQAAWAESGEDDTLAIHSSTQYPSEIQTIVSEVLGLARHKIVVVSPRMGGAFGGKETQGNAYAAIVALAARLTGRPVRVQLDRDVDMALTGKRHPFHAKFRVGHDADGRVLAAEVELVSDGGWSLDLSQPILDRALFHLDNAYYLPAVHFTGRVAKTHTTSHTAFRGFGGPQGILVIEEIMDRIARRTGLPPETVRERNLYHGTGETNRTHYHEDIGDARIPAIWRQVLACADFGRRRAAVDEWNREHVHVKRGLAVTPVKFGISFTLTHYNQAGALVHIYGDGSVQVNHGGTEMGQGLHTKILGIAMRELGQTAGAIRLMPTSTDKVPNASATAASSGSDLNGAAVADACIILRERLAPVAGQLLGAKAEEIGFADGVARVRGTDRTATFAQVACRAHMERISLSATGHYKTPGIHWDWAKSAGRPFHYFACGAAVAEVEVDGYTGMQRVLRVDIVHDVGDSLNPGIDRGQIEGGFMQGMGWLTSEELKWDAKGRLLTHSASTYQIPAMSDAPVEFNVTLVSGSAQPGVIHGSKAVGEPPLMLAFSVREAIRDAVSAFGSKGGEVRLASPATGEAIFAAIRERLENRRPRC